MLAAPKGTSYNQSVIILVSGWPACGKGTYSRWLRDHHSFVHLDLETGDFHSSVLHPVWDSCWSGPDFQPFLQELNRIHPRWVLDWGFPPQCLSIVDHLRSLGVIPWFFVPETEEISRNKWLERERQRNPHATSEAWEQQTRRLRGADTELRQFFGARILQTVRADGAWLPPEQVARALFEVPE